MRRSELRPDPERVRDWMRRTRDRQRDKQAQGWRRDNPPARRNTLPGLRGFTQRVFALYGRRCVVCGGRATQAHHVVALRTLFARSRQDAELLGGDARNGVPVCWGCHAAHENASRRIRRGELPGGAVQWAYEQGFAWVIDDRRLYPVDLERER